MIMIHPLNQRTHPVNQAFLRNIVHAHRDIHHVLDQLSQWPLILREEGLEVAITQVLQHYPRSRNVCKHKSYSVLYVYIILSNVIPYIVYLVVLTVWGE